MFASVSSNPPLLARWSKVGGVGDIETAMAYGRSETIAPEFGDKTPQMITQVRDLRHPSRRYLVTLTHAPTKVRKQLDLVTQGSEIDTVVEVVCQYYDPSWEIFTCVDTQEPF